MLELEPGRADGAAFIRRVFVNYYFILVRLFTNLCLIFCSFILTVYMSEENVFVVGQDPGV